MFSNILHPPLLIGAMRGGGGGGGNDCTKVIAKRILKPGDNS